MKCGSQKRLTKRRRRVMQSTLASMETSSWVGILPARAPSVVHEVWRLLQTLDPHTRIGWLRVLEKRSEMELPHYGRRYADGRPPFK
jgi:hypothetical protein